jgi:hypothetical protein
VITEVPGATPATMPDEEPTVAIPGLALVHVPPGAPSVSVVVAPVQTVSVPPIGVGARFTVTVAVTEQPPGNV